MFYGHGAYHTLYYERTHPFRHEFVSTAVSGVFCIQQNDFDCSRLVAFVEQLLMRILHVDSFL